MAKKLDSVWEIDPHTKIKHIILKTYVQAWFPIMASRNPRIIYMDGFAGPGIYKGGEEGSPILVLKSARDHTAALNKELLFLFVEKDQQRFAHLEQMIDEIKSSLPQNFKIQCVHGEFDEKVGALLQHIEDNNKKLAPCFAFIDPFGFSDTPFEIIKRLMGNPRCEVLITFMFEEINRFKEHPNPKIGEHLDRLFGTSEWRKALLPPNPADQRRALHDCYLAQLKSVAKYVRSFKMVNKSNSTDYFLFFGSNNILGLEKMKEAMWKADPQGEFTFSDYTDASGLMNLFDLPNHDLLKSQIKTKFAGIETPVETIHDFVVAETAFLPSHFKTPVLKPMEASGELEAFRKDGKARRRGTFPDGTWIRFAPAKPKP